MKRRKPSFPIVCIVGFLTLSRSAFGGIEEDVSAVSRDRVLARATLGIQVMKLGAGPAEMRELYSRNAAQPFTPASNLKLVTTAAAIERLGADYKFQTTLALRGQDLVLIGGGDPAFGDATYLKKVGWRSTTVYESWAAQLQKMGVTSINDIAVDDSIFDEDFFHADWPVDQLDMYYEAQVAGMNYNFNLVDVLFPGGGGKPGFAPANQYLKFEVIPSSRSLAVNRQNGGNTVVVRGELPGKAFKTYTTVHDPALYAGHVLRDQVRAAGIKVTGEVKRDRTARQAKAAAESGPGKWPIVGVHETPLAPILARTNKDSANLYAESLVKRMGFDSTSNTAGSWETGTAAVGAYLKSIGVPEGDFALADGSGMSRKNAISPRALARVLCYEFYAPNRDAYIQSLSVAGVDGTLDDRFRGTDLRQRVFGKSGFINGVSTLSGYLKSRDGQWYAFSILVNGIPDLSNGQVKLLQERIVRAVDAEVSPPK